MYSIQAELKKKYEEEQLPASLEHLEKMLSSCGNGEYFVGNKVICLTVRGISTCSELCTIVSGTLIYKRLGDYYCYLHLFLVIVG